LGWDFSTIDAIDKLGTRIIGAHAKDVVVSGYAAAGAGMMDPITWSSGCFPGSRRYRSWRKT
jgi:sugar phosphate isomerase/epimerase